MILGGSVLLYVVCVGVCACVACSGCVYIYICAYRKVKESDRLRKRFVLVCE